MPPVQICPPDEVLRDWLLGAARGKDAEAVGEHLLECRTCGARVERLVASDPLLMNVRAAGGTNSAAADGTLADEILRRIKAPPGQSTPNAELAFLALPLPAFPADLGTLGRYRVVELLGQGGMGMVFRAVDTNLNRTVALKVILPKYAANEKLRARFLEEGRATALVRSAHVAEVYDCDVLDGVPFLTMELLVGMTLDKKPKPLPVDQWRKFGFSIAKGLADAHRAGLIHRDLKPSNIHLGTDARTGKPTVKIIDFGLARPVARDVEVTGTGEMLGTPAYMSPEQARSRPNIDHRTDLYSLGVILYQLATGKLPYATAHEGVFSLLSELASADPLPGVRLAVPDMPADLAGLIDRLLAKNPADRPASADEVMAVLKASAAANPTAAVAKPVVAKAVSADPVSVFAPSMSEADVIPVPVPTPAETQPFVDIADDEEPPAAKPAKRRPVWPFAVAGLLAFALIGVLASGVLKVRTKDGTLELTDLPPDAEVLVDGDTATVTWDKGKQKAEVHVKPGTHRVEVKKDGFTARGEEVTLSDGGRKIFNARLEKKIVAVAPPNPLPSGELILNGDCTTPSLEGWKTIKGNWYKAATAKDHFFCAGDCQEGILQQDVDVSRYAATIDGGEVEFKVAVQFSSFDNDTSQLKACFLDKDNKELALGYDSGEHAHRGAWVPYGKTAAPPAGTRSVRIILRSRLVPRPGNKHNTGYFDNVSLKAIGKAPPPLRTTIGYETLFNGQDLTGWTVEGGEAGVWKVDRGTITATAAAPQTPSFLLSDKAYADFTLRFHFQVADTAAVGAVALRAIGGERTLGKNGLVSNHPLLTLTNPSAGDFTGTAWFLKAAAGNVLPTAKPQIVVGQWHAAEITVRGDTCVASFDDMPCVDLRFDPTAPPVDGFPAGLQRPKGRIGFKAFAGTVNYRNVEVRELTPAATPAATPQFAAAPPGSPLRFVGYSIQSDPALVATVADHANVLLDRSWLMHDDAVAVAARRAGVRLVVAFHASEKAEADGKLVAFIEKNRDVVAGVSWDTPYRNGFTPNDVTAFGRAIKQKFPGLAYWVAFTEKPNGNYELLPVPDEVDVVQVVIYYDATPDKVRAKTDDVLARWVVKANGRPVVLRWTGYDLAPPGIVARSQPDTMTAVVDAAKKYKLAGVLFDHLGANAKGIVGVETNATLIPAVRAAAQGLEFGRPQFAAAPAGSPLRYFGYSILGDGANVGQVAGYTNFLVDVSWRYNGREAVLTAARQAKIPLLIEFEGTAPDHLEKLYAMIDKYRDVVAGVSWNTPYWNRHTPDEVAAFGRSFKKKYPGLQYWVSFVEEPRGKPETQPVPPEVDGLQVMLFYDATPAAIQAKADRTVPNFVEKAKGRPVVLVWTVWDEKAPGLAPRTQPGTMGAVVEAAKKYKLAGVEFFHLGGEPGFHVQGLDTNPALLPEIEAAAKELGFGGPAVAPPPTGFVPPAGFTALFSGKDKLGWTRDGGDVGQWDVADGALVGTSDDYTTRCYLLTEKDYADFTLTFDFKVGDDRSHGGVALRAVLGETVPNNGKPIFDHPLIKLTNAGREAKDATGANHWLKDATPYTEPLQVPRVVAGQWHTARVTVQGDKCTATVDGVPTVDIRLDPAAKSDGNFIPGLKRAKGRVGFQVNTGRMAYRNVAIQELTAPPVDKRAKFALGGKIVREGDELSILPEKVPGNAAVTFGDPAWTDYDVEVDAKGNGWIYFHVTDVANFWDFEAVPAANGYKCQIAIKSEGKFKPVADAANAEASNADGWNRMKVSVRGNLAIGYFNGREVLRHTDARNPAGMVSLGAFQGEARYKNLTVTAPDGTALFQGLPELPAAPVRQTIGFTPLFNGMDLAGWETEGNKNGTWKAENGVIVGGWLDPKDNTGGTNLITARSDYRHFHLRMQVKRSDIGGNRLFLLPSGKADGTGGRYRVWLGSTPPAEGAEVGRLGRDAGEALPLLATPAVGVNAWFRLEVIVQGNRIQVFVDGLKTADHTDPDLPAAGGRIKIHLSGAGRGQFKDVEVQDLPAPPPPVIGFTPLFNGKNTTGWKQDPKYPGDWKVENGVLVGRGPGKHHLYTTRGDYTDFHLKAKVRINAGGNSGVYFRCGDREGEPTRVSPAGYEAQIYPTGQPAEPKTGSLVHRGKPGQLLAQSAAPAGEWFTLEVIAEGNRSRILINGKETADYSDPEFTRGHIALQVWDNPNGGVTKVEYESVEIKELTKAAAAPPVPKGDPFAAGSVWRGVKVIKTGDYAGGTGFYEMTISTRTGAAFTGSVKDNGPNRNPASVTGTIDGDNIEWKESPLGNPAHFTTVRGKHDAGEVRATTKGTFGNRGNSGEARLYHVRPGPFFPPEEFHPIFNGSNLNGWETHAAQRDGWAVSQFGKIVGQGKATSHLYTKKEYGDVHVRVRAKVNGGGNSGVYVRSTFDPQVGAAGFPLGYEAQISANLPTQPTGSLFVWGPTQERSRIADLVRPDEWFDLDLIAKGNTFEVRVNGQQSVKYVDPQARGKTGRIALQLHDGKTAVEFALVAVKELKP